MKQYTLAPKPLMQSSHKRINHTKHGNVLKEINKRRKINHNFVIKECPLAINSSVMDYEYDEYPCKEHLDSVDQFIHMYNVIDDDEMITQLKPFHKMYKAFENRIFNKSDQNDVLRSNLGWIDHHYISDIAIAKDVFITRITKLWFKKPYCWFCGTTEKRTWHVIEHEHLLDDEDDDSDSAGGRFRGRSCRSCNQIERYTKNFETLEQRVVFLKRHGFTDDSIEFLLRLWYGEASYNLPYSVY